MKDRIKLIRKNASLNQTDFAERLGLSQSAITGYESGARVPLDPIIHSICKEFRVNEEWVRYGTGDMYKPLSRNQQILEFVNEAMEGEPDDIKMLALELLTEFTPDDWHRIAELVNKVKEKDG